MAQRVPRTLPSSGRPGEACSDHGRQPSLAGGPGARRALPVLRRALAHLRGDPGPGDAGRPPPGRPAPPAPPPGAQQGGGCLRGSRQRDRPSVAKRFIRDSPNPDNASSAAGSVPLTTWARRGLTLARQEAPGPGISLAGPEHRLIGLPRAAGGMRLLGCAGDGNRVAGERGARCGLALARMQPHLACVSAGAETAAKAAARLLSRLPRRSSFPTAGHVLPRVVTKSGVGRIHAC